MIQTFGACFNNCSGPLTLLDPAGWVVAIFLGMVYLGALIEAIEEHKKGNNEKLNFMMFIFAVLMVFLAYIIYSDATK